MYTLCIVMCLNSHTKTACARWQVVLSCQLRFGQTKNTPLDLAQAGQLHTNRDFSFFHFFLKIYTLCTIICLNSHTKTACAR